MKFRSVLAAVIVIGALFWFGTDPTHREWLTGDSSPVPTRQQMKVRGELSDLERKAQTLTPDSSRRDLEVMRKDLEVSLRHAGRVAEKDYDYVKAEIERLDAAERLKDAQQKLADLGESARKLSKTTDEARGAVDTLKKDEDKAKAAYQTAADRVETLFR
jgi:chromosome segregation ATPase